MIISKIETEIAQSIALIPKFIFWLIAKTQIIKYVTTDYEKRRLLKKKIVWLADFISDFLKWLFTGWITPLIRRDVKYKGKNIPIALAVFIPRLLGTIVCFSSLHFFLYISKMMCLDCDGYFEKSRG
jgi:hypothetical protein